MQQIFEVILVDLPPIDKNVSFWQLPHFHAAISPAGVKGSFYECNLVQRYI